MGKQCKNNPVVLKNLENQNLIESKEIRNENSESDRYQWIRIIEKYNKNFEGFEESWNEVTRSENPVKILKQLAMAIEQFFKSYLDSNQVTPLHIAVEIGSLNLCKYIITKTRIKNPTTKLTMTLEDSETKSSKFSIAVEKSPFNFDSEMTPFHLAAMNGNLNLCKVIMENIENCNPRNFEGNTPLLMAATNGHFEVCKNIMDR